LPARADDGGHGRPGLLDEICAIRQQETILVVGGPGTGKTSLLAACVERLWRTGRRPLVIVADAPAKRAFAGALARAGADSACLGICATLAEHAARWLRSGSAGAGIRPHLTVGGRGATRRILEEAAGGLFAMSWEAFATGDVSLDVPYLSRPHALLDEAAVLFDLLARACVTPDEFEEGCLRGLGAFYGQDVERAVSLLADPDVARRTSRRGRAALRAPREALARQRRAERDLARLLVELFREYRLAAQAAAVRSAEDVIAGLVDWLERDAAAARTLAREVDVLIVDDAEDAEPALPKILGALRGVRDMALVAAGFDGSRIAGLSGRRSLLTAFPNARRIVLTPRAAAAEPVVVRCAAEESEIVWLTGHLDRLLAGGCAPENIAVLTRTHESAGLYAAALRHAGVPAAWPVNAFARPKELADLIALAAVLEDPRDEAHLMRVLSSPLAGLSDKSLWLLCRDRDEQVMLPLDATARERLPATRLGHVLAANVYEGRVDETLPTAARESLAGLRVCLEMWRREVGERPLAARLAYLAETAGFREAWRATPAWEGRRAEDDLRRLCAVATAAESAGVRAAAELEEWLEKRILVPVPAAPEADAIAVEAIGSCKGQRWDHVVVAGIAWERFPRIYVPQGLAFSRTFGLLVRENVARGSSQTAKYAWYYAKFGAKDLYLEEERRVLRYALSRGRQTSAALGFGQAPGWARGYDLLSDLESQTCAG
jgi:superfamily I DNA/RNA helicase